VVSDGARIYYHRQYGGYSDPANNIGDAEGMVTVWDLASPPEPLLRTSYLSLLGLWIRDSYVYTLGAVIDLTFVRRSIADPPQAAMVSAPNMYPTRAWFTEDWVWWSAPNALWRSPRTGPIAREQVATADHDGWITGNSTRVFRYLDTGSEVRLVADVLPSLSPDESFGTHVVRGDEAETLVVDEEAVFMNMEDGTELQRISLDGSGESVAVAPTELRTHNVLLEEGWIYWGAELEDGTASINRRQRDLAAPAHELVRGHLNPRLFALTSGALVYFSGDRFFVKELPPSP
jgi:hypothetical protein